MNKYTEFSLNLSLYDVTVSFYLDFLVCHAHYTKSTLKTSKRRFQRFYTYAFSYTHPKVTHRTEGKNLFDELFITCLWNVPFWTGEKR